MIKKYTSDDFHRCRELFVEVFNGPPWNDKWTDESARIYLQELTDHRRFLGYTSWDNGSLTGVVFCHMKHYYRGDEIFIDEMFISPGRQRKGLGSELMREVESYTAKNSIISVTLLTGVDKPAFDFYLKLGYKHAEHLAFMHKRVL